MELAEMREVERQVEDGCPAGPVGDIEGMR